MSRTPCFYIERYSDKRKCYELQHPYVWNYEHTERIPADLYPYNGDHDMFGVVENRPENFPDMRGIHYGFPVSVSKEITDEYASYFPETGVEVRWFTYADLLVYLLTYPEIEQADWDEDGNKIKVKVPNPLQGLKNRVDAFMEVMDSWGWEEDASLIRIVYWIA